MALQTDKSTDSKILKDSTKGSFSETSKRPVTQQKKLNGRHHADDV